MATFNDYIDKCEDILNSEHVDLAKLYRVANNRKEKFKLGYYYKLVQLIVDELDDDELGKLLSSLKLPHNRDYMRDLVFSNRDLHIIQPSYEIFNLAKLNNSTITIDCDKLPNSFFFLADVSNCTININEGCTSIGENAFFLNDTENVQINLPKSLKYFGNIDESIRSPFQEVKFNYAGTKKEFEKIEKFDEKAISKYTIVCTDGIFI